MLHTLPGSSASQVPLQQGTPHPNSASSAPAAVEQLSNQEAVASAAAALSPAHHPSPVRRSRYFLLSFLVSLVHCSVHFLVLMMVRYQGQTLDRVECRKDGHLADRC